MPSVIFSYTHSAHEGAAHKHPPAVSSHIFPRVTYAKVRSPCKNAPFLALGHFFAVRLSTALNKEKIKGIVYHIKMHRREGVSDAERRLFIAGSILNRM